MFFLKGKWKALSVRETQHWQGCGNKRKKREKGNVKNMWYLSFESSIIHIIQFNIHDSPGKEGN